MNFNGHKSCLGDYYVPLAVFLDVGFLKTLPRRHIRNGAAEIIKMGVIKDKELFELLESHGEELQHNRFQNSAIARHVIRRAIQGILEELEPNLQEERLERLVDFGHTFSPQIEMQALPALLHGEAVAIDMALSTCIAYERNLLSESERDRIIRLIRLFGLPVFHRVCTSALLSRALQKSTQHRDGLQRCPLPIRIGMTTFVNDITDEELKNALRILKKYARSSDT